MAGYGSIAGDVGGAVADIFSGLGNEASSDMYSKAAGFEDTIAGLAQQNVEESKWGTDIKEGQTVRQVYKTISGQQSDVAGAGFAASGSALDIMRDSVQQGALNKSLVRIQGDINTRGYQGQVIAAQERAQMDRDLADKADTASFGNFIGAGLKGLSGIAAFAAL